MPKRHVTELGEPDRVFRAVADRSRRLMVERLARGPATVSDLAAPLGIALPSVMQHLDVLADAGIVESQKVGRIRTVQLVPGALDPVADWVDRQRTPAERRIDRLAGLLSRPVADGSATNEEKQR